MISSSEDVAWSGPVIRVVIWLAPVKMLHDGSSDSCCYMISSSEDVAWSAPVIRVVTRLAPVTGIVAWVASLRKNTGNASDVSAGQDRSTEPQLIRMRKIK
jgi:hypothetical protein